jgi:hypothetical protein
MRSTEEARAVDSNMSTKAAEFDQLDTVIYWLVVLVLFGAVLITAAPFWLKVLGWLLADAERAASALWFGLIWCWWRRGRDWVRAYSRRGSS